MSALESNKTSPDVHRAEIVDFSDGVYSPENTTTKERINRISGFSEISHVGKFGNFINFKLANIEEFEEIEKFIEDFEKEMGLKYRILHPAKIKEEEIVIALHLKTNEDDFQKLENYLGKQNEEISMCIMHCSIPQRINRNFRLALQEIIEEELRLKIFCPSQHKKHLTTQEIALGEYWPQEKTAEYISGKHMDTDIIIASPPVLKLVEEKLIFLLSSNPPIRRILMGETPCEQISKLPQMILETLEIYYKKQGSKIPLDTVYYYQNIVPVMLEISEACKEKLSAKIEREEYSDTDPRKHDYLNQIAEFSSYQKSLQTTSFISN